MSSAVEYEELESPEGKRWNEHSNVTYDEGYIKLGSVKGVFARSYLKYYERIKNFCILDDDLWVVSFPKTGTSWTQEMVWCIMNDLDFKAAEVDLNERFPFFEVRANWSPKLASAIRNVVLGENAPPGPEDPYAFDPNFLTSFDLVESAKSPRFVKSHLHFSLLPQQLIDGSTKAKMVYVARNPKDTCVSFFHHSCMFDGYRGSLEEFVEEFITDNVYSSPFFTHLREFWEIRDRPDVLFLKYEDMKEDLPAIIRKTAEFLGKSLSDEEVSSLAKHLSFESMKNNPAVSQEKLIKTLQKIHGLEYKSTFVRKGQVGSWKEELPTKLMDRFDRWIEENAISGLYP